MYPRLLSGRSPGRSILSVAISLGGVIAAGCTSGHVAGNPQPPAASSSGVPAPKIPADHGLPAVQYAPDHPPPAWPDPLPYPVLIADRGNDRIIEVTPDKRVLWQYPPAGGLPAGTNFGSDDDAFFTPDGRGIITNEEHQGTITVLDYYTGQQTWTFGEYGRSGSGPRLLNYPDDAFRLPDGTTIVADIRNCRALFISPDKQILQTWGKPQSGTCKSDAKNGYLGYPNGDTPQPNGDVLLSLISGNRIVLMSHDGQVKWDVQAPAIRGYVSDAQLLPDGDVIVCDYNGLTDGDGHPQQGGQPGRVVIFNPRTGKVDWLYDVGSGDGVLDHPSLAEVLPNGNVMLNDDYNNRVIVIDRASKQIVWQYGLTGKPGTGPGELNTPDGFAIDYFRDWRGWLAQQGSAFQPRPFLKAQG